MPQPGDLGASSIFEDDRRQREQALRYERAEQTGGKVQMGSADQQRDPKNMAPVLDPDPNSRERWERKKVIQMLTKGGRLGKREVVKRTERESLHKSEMLKTSVKKLGMLARQIQGKRLDEAIVQMRFSRKKVATEVLKQLEAARDEAIVARGMGLGKVGAEEEEETGFEASGQSQESGKPVQIQLKNGKRHTVADKSEIYIDQAWVGRGPYGNLPDYRARGRIYIMKTPWTSISLLLKEEGTRVREYEEREAKRLRKRKEKVWVPLPDRPVGGAGHGRGWYAW